MTKIEKFKYDPMTQAQANSIIDRYKDEPVMEYIKELWELIRYQKDIIAKQNIEIISNKHKNAWKMYDKGDK